MNRVLILAVLLPSIAFAAGYGGAEGKNSLGEIIRIESDLGETISVQKNSEDFEQEETYVTRDECPSFFNEDPATVSSYLHTLKEQFSCRKDGKSPLAGTTYKITTSEDWKPCESFPEDMGIQQDLEPGIDYGFDAPGEVYVCIAGCDNPRAPQIFYVSPWECG